MRLFLDSIGNYIIKDPSAYRPQDQEKSDQSLPATAEWRPPPLAGSRRMRRGPANGGKGQIFIDPEELFNGTICGDEGSLPI